ncbi:SRPBCC domain-containing protein [Caulobacter sp. 17J65-9]|uniref:SRPBCC domain-containing protein n=1 Tax=Caulobacter sp. 17J65-9 TaxID=2709382 RepID=UPI0013C96E1E|nr:SRPBCC domain-containing protein [Caulobacter sp. 17J65-9]NEX91146.1 SRPBCC domain-containing protein [Caulobacter sp. 17J65-9]
MNEVTSELILKASPDAVWRLLTDFPGYPSWRPGVRIEGPASKGAELKCTLRLRDNRDHRLPLEIVEFDPMRRLSWALGLPGLLQFIELHELSPTAGGVRLRHAVRCKGLLSPLVRSVFTRRAAFFLEATDTAITGRFNSLPPLRQSGKGFRQPKKARGI